MLLIVIGLVLIGVASTIPVVEVDGRRIQGWEAAEVSYRFLVKDYPKMPMPSSQLIQPAGGMSLLGIGTPRATTDPTPMDGVMASTALLGIGGLDKSNGIGKIFLYWVAWSWAANLGLAIGLITLLAQRAWLWRIRWILVSLSWISVSVALVGAVLVLGWGKDPHLFGPAYWVWLASLVVIGIGVTMEMRKPLPA